MWCTSLVSATVWEVVPASLRDRQRRFPAQLNTEINLIPQHLYEVRFIFIISVLLGSPVTHATSGLRSRELKSQIERKKNPIMRRWLTRWPGLSDVYAYTDV